MNVDERAGRAGFSLRAATEPALDVMDALHETKRTRRRRQRNGRLVGIAVVVALVVAVFATAPTVLADRARELPGTPPTPSPMPGVHALATDPLMTGDSWASFWSPTARPVVRTAAQPPRLMECIGDVDRLGAVEVYSATFVMEPPFASRPGGTNNEYVLRFHDQASATSAFAALRNQFARCHQQQHDPGFLYPEPIDTYAAPNGPIDEMFEGEGSTTPKDKAMGLEAGRYQVYAAREGNVVVVVESYGGWGDNTGRVLDTLLDKALGPDWWRS